MEEAGTRIPPQQGVFIVGRLHRIRTLEGTHRFAQEIAGRQGAARAAARE